MSERKNIKRNQNRVNKEVFLKTGRKGHSKLALNFPEDKNLQALVRMGLL
jgi:hypothetical protein